MAAPSMPARERSMLIPTEVVEELNCPICFESKSLLVLPCQHRCCPECIEQIAHQHRRRLTCPVCRTDASIPAEGFPVCRLSEYFREQLRRCNASDEGDRTPCYHCDGVGEARCKICSNFLCYKCVLQQLCGSDGVTKHVSVDLKDLKVSATRVLQSWVKRTADEIEQLEELKTRQEKIKESKRSWLRLCESKLEEGVDVAGVILFVEKMSKIETSNPLPEEVAAVDKDAEKNPIVEMVPLSTLASISLQGSLLQGDCTAVCLGSSGNVIIGTVSGDLRTYSREHKLKSSCVSAGAVWSICEYMKKVYIQCGERTIAIYPHNLGKVTKSWKLTFTCPQIAVSNDTVYTIDSDNQTLVKFSLTGVQTGLLTHPSFVFPYSLKAFSNDSIVVCDTKAHAIFLFAQERCMWQVGVARCSGIAVDWSAKNIWVKVFNKGRIIMLSRDGEKMGLAEIDGGISSISHDMAAKGDRLYLATNSGLLFSRPPSSVCVLI